MNIFVNDVSTAFHGSSVEDLLQQQAPESPFAVAVNTVFIPKQQYATYKLSVDDHVDIVHPVVGG